MHPIYDDVAPSLPEGGLQDRPLKVFGGEETDVPDTLPVWTQSQEAFIVGTPQV